MNGSTFGPEKAHPPGDMQGHLRSLRCDGVLVPVERRLDPMEEAQKITSVRQLQYDHWRTFIVIDDPDQAHEVRVLWDLGKRVKARNVKERSVNE